MAFAEMRDDLKLRQCSPQSSETNADGSLSGRSTKLDRFSAKRIEISIGLEIRSLRKSKGLTVAALGAAAGVSTGMLSKVEHGSISSSLATLYALARALSVPITRLFAGIDDEEHLLAGDENPVRDHRAAAAGGTQSLRLGDHGRRGAIDERDQDGPARRTKIPSEDNV
jgi:transcriptional regulator with XRE-family HTH domain